MLLDSRLFYCLLLSVKLRKTLSIVWAPSWLLDFCRDKALTAEVMEPAWWGETGSLTLTWNFTHTPVVQFWTFILLYEKSRISLFLWVGAALPSELLLYEIHKHLTIFGSSDQSPSRVQKPCSSNAQFRARCYDDSVLAVIMAWKVSFSEK